MYTYLTHGSDYYMNRLIDQHQERELLKFNGPEDVILYEETDQKSVFSTPESFEVVEAIGDLTDDKPLMLRYFQVTDDHRKSAESALTSHDANFYEYEGFQAFRLLRPLRTQSYIAVFQFDTVELAEDFKKSSLYRTLYDNEVTKAYQSADFISNVNYTKFLVPYDKEQFAPESE